MKQRGLMFVFAILFCGNLIAQTVTVQLSGTITIDSTGLPVPNHPLIIKADSNSYGYEFYTTRTTGPNGMYDCVINNVPATGAAVIFIVKTENCDGSNLTETFPASNNPVTVNFEICDGSAGNCEAEFEYEADSIQEGMIHFFDASYPQGEISGWKWAFGDPGSGSCNTSTLQNPTHTFSTSGIYNVCMTIIANSGCTHSRCHEIHVEIDSNNCESWFTYEAEFLTVQFAAHTQSSFPTTYTWFIGNPVMDTLTGINPVYTFPAQGVYHVKLITEDSTGCQSDYVREVDVHSTCVLHGKVFAGDTCADHGLVELIRMEAGVMVIAGSSEINDSLGHYEVSGVLPGNYYLRASLLQTSSFYGQYLPTYYLHAVNWTNAQIIELGQPDNPYNIELVHLLSANPGPGTINGSISMNTKINSGGAPAPDVEIILFNTYNEPLAFTTSGQDGTFSFTDITFGSYSVYPEMFGKNTTPASILLDNTTPAVTTSFTIQGNNILGSREESAVRITGVSEVYPSPASDKVFVTVNTLRKKDLAIRVFSITGQILDEFRFTVQKGTSQLTLPVDQLSDGLYYLNISDELGDAVTRKLVIRKR